MQVSGSHLKEAVRKLGLTQEQAAGKLGITRQTLGNWFKLSELDQNTLYDVKRNLHIDILEFLNYSAPEDENGIDFAVNEPVASYSADACLLREALVAIRAMAEENKELINVIKQDRDEMVNYGTRLDRVLNLLDKLYDVKFIEPNSE